MGDNAHYGNWIFGNGHLLALDNTKKVNIAGVPLPYWEL